MADTDADKTRRELFKGMATRSGEQPSFGAMPPSARLPRLSWRTG
jgi:hypothetical protein